MRSSATGSVGTMRGLLLIILAALHHLALPSEATGVMSLYKEGDNILELDINTFNSTVYNKTTAYFVEFYSSWCGHCIDYAPHYVKFATLVKSWRNVVVVAALNCADEINAPICREHEIDAFPTLRYFKYMAASRKESVRFESSENKKDMALLSSRVASWAKEDYDRAKPSTWPKYEITQSQSTLSDLWALSPHQAQLLALVVEDVPTKYGFSLLTNYAGDQRASIAIVFPSHPLAAAYGGVQVPALHLFKRTNPTQPTYSSNTAITWLEMKEEVDKQLAEGLGVGGGQEAITTTPPSPNDLPASVNWKQFEVQYLDLITALHYLLTQEVPRKPIISHEHMAALKGWMRVLRRYGPGSAPVKRLFYRLDQYLQPLAAISAEQWLGKVEEVQAELGHPIPPNTSYVACRGSKPYLRGYTCGLWTLAHTITVEAYRQEKENLSFDPFGELLEPFHQFIVEFLSCEVCAKNFNDLTHNNAMQAAKRPEDAVLWLWRAHNNVNKRLAGEKSDDPFFPKQQFPNAILCPECHSGHGAFDEQKTLAFLLKYYSEVKVDGVKATAGYQVKEFVDGKLVKVTEKRLNPKFVPMAGKVDQLEELEGRLQKEQGGPKRHWKALDPSSGGGGTDVGPSTDRTTFYLIWMVIVGLALMFAYAKYRENRAKFWKMIYGYRYSNDYKL